MASSVARYLAKPKSEQDWLNATALEWIGYILCCTPAPGFPVPPVPDFQVPRELEQAAATESMQADATTSSSSPSSNTHESMQADDTHEQAAESSSPSSNTRKRVAEDDDDDDDQPQPPVKRQKPSYSIELEWAPYIDRDLIRSKITCRKCGETNLHPELNAYKCETLRTGVFCGGCSLHMPSDRPFEERETGTCEECTNTGGTMYTCQVPSGCHEIRCRACSQEDGSVASRRPYNAYEVGEINDAFRPQLVDAETGQVIRTFETLAELYSFVYSGQQE